MLEERKSDTTTLEGISQSSRMRPPIAAPNVELPTSRQGVSEMESCGRKVVVVEDEGLIAADLKGRLEHAGYGVPAVAGSGVEALRIIRETSPDLVLMDIRINGPMDGIQVAQQVRKEFDIPVVYLTAYEDRETLERASQTQAFGYIKKPIASSSLQGSIEMAISKHQHERHLREQRDWFSANFAAVPQAVVVTDGRGRVSYLNQVAEEITGWSADHALGSASQDLLRFFYRQSGQPVEDLVPVAMLEGETVPLPPDICLRDHKERRHVVEGSIAPRWREGRIEGTLVVFHDVTVFRFEQELVSQDSKQQGLRRLAEGIARHLEQELGVVAGESSKLLESLPPDSSLRERARAIEGATMDAIAVASRLRAFAQQAVVCPGLVRVNEVLTRLEDAWKRILPKVRVVLDPDQKAAQADAWQLTRALVMVLQHARKHMEDGAEVWIETSRPEIEAMREWIRIRVSYTSAVEDAAALERLFEPSWTAEAEDLPVAYGLIRKMGGLLTARLEQGPTVSFEIYLQSVEVRAAGASAAGHPAILLVDANPEIRRVLHAHFEQHGYNLLETGTCEEAVLLAELYQGDIPLVIANPAPDDAGRARFVETLAAMKPGICVRLLEGYWEERPATGSAKVGSTCRYLTKWNLMEWAHHLAAAAAYAVAGN